ncbi:MAG: cell division protein ZipA C-terminal FtsZ-binding domain-containing protein [Lautropia sp.]|nr:cell division protein ZipA C-terminal FtsZ-binding domain-containing protein [Lautropia sp.]
MSTLSLSIIALIVVVLVIVIANNLWQAYRRSQADPLAGIRAGRLESGPDTLTGPASMGHGRDRRDPVLGEGSRSRIPPSLAARPAQVSDLPPSRGMSAAFDDPGADELRAARGEGQHPSLALEDEDFIETPFENPAAVRPWSSREEPSSRPARAGAARLPEAQAPVQGLHSRDPHAPGSRLGGDQGRQHSPFEQPAEALHGRAGRIHAAIGGDMSHADWQDRPPAQTLRASSDEVPAVPSRSVPGAEGSWRAQAADGNGATVDRVEPYPAGAAAAGAGSDQPAHASEQGQSSMQASRQTGEASAEPEASAPAAAASASQRPEAVEPEAWPTAQVEHSVILEPPAPVNTDRLIALTSSLRHVGSKPVRIEVERLGGHWSTLAAGDKAVRMRCSLLLANRQGPLNAVELSDFNATIESLAVQLQAPCTIPDMAPILRNARDLDALAARLDTQIEVIVELSESPDPGRLAAIARQQGLSDRGHGRYEAFADSGDSLFALALSKTRDQIVFVLDVPRTAEHHEAWQGMVACASSFAQALGGRLIDSAGRGLSVGMIEMVARQLSRRYLELAQAGLAAGQPATLRVFH